MPPAAQLGALELKSARELVIAEEAMNAKRAGARTIDDPGHFPQTLNPYFFPAPVRSGYKYLDPHFGPHRRTSAADDECAILRYVPGKATLGVFLALGPVKDEWEP
jgi:hypothetical protein